ncbi:undecaprenyl-phosphate galactose phosphotransferase WbaP [Lonepinella sp. MS14436]|uniref:undecaprenyl-phosphate galactose phosphotransferase WbaP n=1 Tax=Lonepinella sp. MS14436 TaxID=3003619 RepID=UPI0036DA6145
MNKQILCKYILAMVDFISLFSAALLSLAYNHYVRSDFFENNYVAEFFQTHFCITFCAIIWYWLRLRHYTYRKPFWFELKEILRTIFIFAIIELAILAFSKLDFSRGLWLGTWFISFTLVPLCRFLIKKYLIYTQWYIKDTFIIGAGQNAIDAYNALKSESYLGFNLKGFLVSEHYSPELDDINIPIYVATDLFLLNIAPTKLEQVIIALEEQESEELDFWIRTLSKHRYRYVSVIPSLRGLPLYSTDISFLFSYDVLLLRINNNLAKHSSRIVKRTMDIILSSILIVTLSPFALLLALIIKLDGGNAIYKHKRIGQNGQKFSCYKFRSMVVNSEEVLTSLLNTNSEIKAEWEKDFKLKNDPRITKIGKFLRQYSLDELPQLFNVLKGNMSLVGPRPIVEDELVYYQNNVDYYFMAKPGMTGLWQISGRNDIDYEKRIYFDSWYVKNWSLWNDIVILLKTVNVVLKRHGAY